VNNSANGIGDKRLWVKAYDWVKESIFSGKLEEGLPLSENMLAQEVKMSRTPIREALRKLAQDGFVMLVPGKGAIVSATSIDDVREIYEIRRLLEPYAARTAVYRIPDGFIDEIEEKWEDTVSKLRDGCEINLSDVAALDMSFHSSLIRYTANGRLRDAMLPYNAQIERFQLLSAKSLSNLMETTKQHLNLIECIRKRDGDELACQLLKHIISSEENVMRLYLPGRAN
jgi:DNA-binding GntR family transcriptional regulator